MPLGGGVCIRRLRHPQRAAWPSALSGTSPPNMVPGSTGRDRVECVSAQCLHERMETQQHIEAQAQTWQQRRNAAKVRVDWRFGVQDARCKLKRLYPKLLPG